MLCIWAVVKKLFQLYDNLQYGDNCVLVSHSLQDLQSVLYVRVRAYRAMQDGADCQHHQNITNLPIQRKHPAPTFTVHCCWWISVRCSIPHISGEYSLWRQQVQSWIQQASATFERLSVAGSSKTRTYILARRSASPPSTTAVKLGWQTAASSCLRSTFCIPCHPCILGITWCDHF